MRITPDLPPIGFSPGARNGPHKSYEPLAHDNPHVFAHVRRFEEDIVLCVHNLARSAQAVKLDLAALAGLVPEEMLGQSKFPRIEQEPYLLTLGPRGFYWFRLTPADD